MEHKEFLYGRGTSAISCYGSQDFGGMLLISDNRNPPVSFHLQGQDGIDVLNRIITSCEKLKRAIGSE